MPFPSPNDIKLSHPLPLEDALLIMQHRQTIANLLTGKDQRFVIILGPCSLHHAESALIYAEHVRALQREVGDSCFLVMRAHVEKPRTCFGWRGLLYDPFLSGEEDLLQGIHVSRELLVQLAHIGVPLACEFLDPLTAPFFSDLISWGMIGARTSASPIHRQLASSLPLPVGFKNSIDGNWQSALHGALVAGSSHSFLHLTDHGTLSTQTSRGNPYTHVILRGGNQDTNFDAAHVFMVTEQCAQAGLNHRLLIDCSHGNSHYRHQDQPVCFSSVLQQYQNHPTLILGTMLESHIEEGKQSLPSSHLSPYKSVTDSCLGLEITKELIFFAHKQLSSLPLCR
ncbi:MAG: 3-deoxy-7-phosphoheptulonate synthase [Chlamydiae bacterium]|nr:3-deoxy-7-phosphoheptulonate synthase [Chlamydiota bacterium]